MLGCHGSKVVCDSLFLVLSVKTAGEGKSVFRSRVEGRISCLHIQITLDWKFVTLAYIPPIPALSYPRMYYTRVDGVLKDGLLWSNESESQITLQR